MFKKTVKEKLQMHFKFMKTKNKRNKYKTLQPSISIVYPSTCDLYFTILTHCQSCLCDMLSNVHLTLPS